MSSIGEILKKYKNKIDSYDLELIIESTLKKPRSFILAHPEFRISKKLEVKSKKYIKRRIKGEPLAYILGYKEFYGLDFKVNKSVLTPRPETEMLVDEALNHITHNIKHITFIDVGTGSGCIIITLAKLLNKKSPNPLPHQCAGQVYQGGFYKFFATDISKSALKIARQNAKLHKVDNKIKFLRGNLLKPFLKKSSIVNRQSSIVITANLPYLTPSQVKISPSIKHEPKIALDAGPDGLKYYRRLFKQVKKLKMLCVMCYVLCEISPIQSAKIKKIIKSHFPAGKIQMKKDLRGLNRIVMAKI